MNETPVYVDMPHRRTIHPKGDKTVDMVTSGNEKTRFTVVITASADGRIWPGFMILRGLKKIPKCYIPSNIVLVVSDSGTMDEQLIIEYIDRILKPIL